ncbi:hypothetical protein GCK72_006896 [Caenorhabditis remanei]|uniref:Uncharacterized protein n=1 Tax=Caenorhabditis remanei TaxID=31234 RepID=A0A6A5HGG5_CAERE|nr:hypothetical protein GCK72_006896 [Caenorhabditis remanei]KAF1766938.1 hypothetical protein GCK72_006896 [Caenorhabditis remanei]
MVFSVITAVPIITLIGMTQYSYIEKKTRVPWEMNTINTLWVGVLTPVLENSHVTINVLFGMIQSGFICNILNILHVQAEWNLYYARIMSMIFSIYAAIRMVWYQTILLPKLPLRIHWKSIILITLFFALTGYFLWPYCTSSNVYIHVYLYLLSIETSIWYYTKEFRLFSRYPRTGFTDYARVYHTTVHRYYSSDVHFQQ